MTTEQMRTNKEKKNVMHPTAPIPQDPLAQLKEPDLLALQRALADPAIASPAGIVALQKTAGNRALQRLIVQRQAPEEEELQLKAVQRQPPEQEEALMMKPLQRVGPEGGPVPEEVTSAINRARGAGQPLDGPVREQMSEVLGHDFSTVRVHTDSEADVLNQQLSARAFTTGQDIFFRQGEYQPGSSSGRELIAHELTHVVQQGTGRVRGDGRGMSVRPAGDAFEQGTDITQEQSQPQLSTLAQPVVQRDGVTQDSWPGGVKKLTEGIEDTDSNAKKLDRLCKNFKNLDFQYTGHKDHQLVLMSSTCSGDCQTLAQAMAKVATDYLGIRDVGAYKAAGDILVWGEEFTIDRSREPTVNDGKGWTFDNHWLVSGEEGPYDPLFARKADMSAWQRRTETKDATREGVGPVQIDTYGATKLIGAFIPETGMKWYTEEYLTANPGALEPKVSATQVKETKQRPCFITTACIEAKGLPDDCYELTTLRAFRDGYMRDLANGPGMLTEYYKIAPQIVERIQEEPDARKIWERLYGHITEAVDFIISGEDDKALQAYSTMVHNLTARYLVSYPLGESREAY